jgi:hypothetical protein
MSTAVNKVNNSKIEGKHENPRDTRVGTYSSFLP